MVCSVGFVAVVVAEEIVSVVVAAHLLQLKVQVVCFCLGFDVDYQSVAAAAEIDDDDDVGYDGDAGCLLHCY